MITLEKQKEREWTLRFEGGWEECGELGGRVKHLSWSTYHSHVIDFRDTSHKYVDPDDGWAIWGAQTICVRQPVSDGWTNEQHPVKSMLVRCVSRGDVNVLFVSRWVLQPSKTFWILRLQFLTKDFGQRHLKSRENFEISSFQFIATHSTFIVENILFIILSKSNTDRRA